MQENNPCINPGNAPQQEGQQAVDPYQEENAALDDRAKEDSFVMRTLKEGIRTLRQLREAHAPAAKILNQYDWLIWYCNDQYLRGKRPGSKYANRHRKVRQMVEEAEELRQRFIQQNPGITDEQLIRAERTDNADDERIFQRDESAIREDTADLNAKTAAFIPHTAAAFQQAKGRVLAAYDELISDYRSITNRYCILGSAKTKRMKARRILRRLEKERQIVDGYTLDNRARDQFRRWNTDFVTETVPEVTDQGLQRERKVFVVKKEGHELAEMIREMAGVGDCYATLEKVQKVGGLQGYAAMKKNTLEQELARTHVLGIDLIFSGPAIQKMETIQIVDMLCGVTARNNDEIIVTTRVKRIHNRDYLVVDDVQILDKRGAFGDQAFQTLNVQNEEQRTRQFLTNSERMRFGAYDGRVADRIIALETNVLTNYLRAKGAQQATITGFADRLNRLRSVLSNDKTEDYGKRRSWST